MPRYSLRACSLALSLILPTFLSAQAWAAHLQSQLHRRDGDGYDSHREHVSKPGNSHSQKFFRFLSRPDIDSPRWKVKVYDEDALAPGYWFLGVYEEVHQKTHGENWVGPHIYDGKGELVWSGASKFKNYNTFDFKIQQMDGKDVMTLVYPEFNKAVIMDESYEIYKTIDFDDYDMELNMHDFNLKNNGTRALALHNNHQVATKEMMQAVDWHKECLARFTGFEDVDVKNSRLNFKWNPYGHIEVQETTKFDRPMKDFCSGGPWDFFHPNTIDLFPDGDYLLSSRYMNTIYKISHKTGEIVWRLGGTDNVLSDFKLDGHFSGQHDPRCRSQNETHIIISLLDNAWSPGLPGLTNSDSRGMVLSLRTDKKRMTAEVLATYGHPRGGYAEGRGNMQYLPNGNKFLAWWDRARHSEHAEDGKLVMEANLREDLKSYRNYKFPWVGRPAQPPDVHSAAVHGRKGNQIVTIVHVSWNGATEVAKWNMYHTTADGEKMTLVGSTARQGFESALTYDGYASFVVAEALDRNNQTLGKSLVVKTIPPVNLLNPAVIEEVGWLQHFRGNSSTLFLESGSVFSNPIFAFFAGVICCAVAGLTAWAVWTGRWERLAWWRRRDNDTAYAPLWEAELEDRELEDGGESGGHEKDVGSDDSTLGADNEDPSGKLIPQLHSGSGVLNG